MPRFLQQFLQWYLDLPAPPAGQGTAWRLESGAGPGSPGALPLLGWIAAVAVVLVIAVYHRDAARLRWFQRWGLILLRLSIVGLLLVMLSRVSLRIERTELPAVAVLIDVSASMGLTDRYADRRLAAAARQLALERPGPRTGEPTRLEIVQWILTRHDGRWLKLLQETHQVRIDGFDEHLRPLTLSTDEEPSSRERPRLLEGVRQMTAEGALTAPATALRELLEEYRGRSLSGVILFTDGVATAGEDERLSVAATLARERGTPLFPIGVGSEEPARDIELYDLLTDDVVYSGDPVTLSVRLRSFGYVGRTTELRVDAEGEDRPLATRTVTLPADGVPRVEELTFVPRREGELPLRVSLALLPGESDPHNNVLRRTITVRRDQFRVLLVERAPRWEYRALKPVLERDDTLQLETFLQEADLDFAPEDRTALSTFPASREELARYDAVIWGDVDLRLLDQQVPERLREFVREHGGGLILIAGEEFNPVDYLGTPLEVLLPVVIDAAATPPDPLPSGRFRLERTVEGRSWPMLRLADDTQEDDSVWRSLPAEIDWLLPVQEVKPGAQVLAIRPAADALTAAAPAIVHQRYGRGQVLFHATDSLWTWRRRVEDRYFGRYWSQAVRTVAAGRIRRSESGYELTTDRRIYQPGDPVQFRLRAPRAVSATSELPDQATVWIEAPGGRLLSAPLTRRAGESELWEGTATDLPIGEYQARLEGDDLPRPPPGCTFVIERPNRELRNRVIARRELEQAAKLTHGAFHLFAEADAVPAQIPRGRAVLLTQSRPIPLWNRWEFLLLLTGLLALEWILRKRLRLV